MTKAKGEFLSNQPEMYHLKFLLICYEFKAY